MASIISLFAVTNSYARNGIYFTAEGGNSYPSGFPSREDTGADRIKNDESFSSGRISVGYNHDVNCWFGLGMNIGLGHYGREHYYFPEGETTISNNTLEFLGVATLHLKYNTDLFCRVGGIRLTSTVSGHDAHEDKTQVRPELMLGGAYNFTPHLAANISYLHIKGQEIDDLRDVGAMTPTINGVLLGVQYTF